MAIKNFIAGDTAVFTNGYSDYAPADYQAIIYFNGPSTLSITGSASTVTTGSFDFTVIPSASAYMKTGLYGYSIRVTSASIAKTIDNGNITIYPNPATQVNKEALCYRMIELIEKALLNQLSTGEAAESFSIAGRSISLMNRTELLNERGFWNRERKALINAKTGNSGIKQIIAITSTPVPNPGQR